MKFTNILFFLVNSLFTGIMFAGGVTVDSTLDNGNDSLGSNYQWLPYNLVGFSDLNSAHSDSIITLVTTPDNAAVYSDTVLIGYSPLKLTPTRNVTIRKKGYEPAVLSLSGKSGRHDIALTKLPAVPGELFFETNTFQLVSAAIIVFGGTAAYLKIKADENFDSYQVTGNNTYLDKTKKYDIYSGIAFGVMQVNFGYLIYKFLVTE